jgi:flagellar biosynthesis regulator FlaF
MMTDSKAGQTQFCAQCEDLGKHAAQLQQEFFDLECRSVGRLNTLEVRARELVELRAERDALREQNKRDMDAVEWTTTHVETIIKQRDALQANNEGSLKAAQYWKDNYDKLQARIDTADKQGPYKTVCENIRGMLVTVDLYTHQACCDWQKENSDHYDALIKIQQWANAYPLEVFPEPDFKKTAQVLKENGMTIDAISASNMRHVLSGIKDIVADAIRTKDSP